MPSNSPAEPVFVVENPDQIVRFSLPPSCPGCRNPGVQLDDSDAFRCSTDRSRCMVRTYGATGLILSVTDTLGIVRHLPTPVRSVAEIPPMPPPACPQCGQPLDRRTSNTLFCANPRCEAARVRVSDGRLQVHTTKEEEGPAGGTLLASSAREAMEAEQATPLELFVPIRMCPTCKMAGVLGRREVSEKSRWYRQCPSCVTEVLIKYAAIKEDQDNEPNAEHCPSCGKTMLQLSATTWACIEPRCGRRKAIATIKTFAKGSPENMRTILSGWEFEATTLAGVRRRDGEYSLEALGLEDILTLDRDGSVRGEGLEIKTSNPMPPAEGANALSAFLAGAKPAIDDTCGVHFHLSINRPHRSPDPKRDKWFERRFTNNLFSLASMFERRIFALMPESRRDNRFCRKISAMFRSKAPAVKEKMGELCDAKHANDKRYCWLNFVELWRPDGIKTVEFRLLGNTGSPAYILAWFRTCLALVYGSIILDTLENADSLLVGVEAINDALADLEATAKMSPTPTESAVNASYLQSEIKKLQDVINNELKELK